MIDSTAKRLELLDANLYMHKFADDILILEEKEDEGVAKVEIGLSHETISFLKLEEKGLKYFKNRKCADYLLFENISEELWCVHIVELKKTITLSIWAKIKKQFEGALLNALALAGFLDFSFTDLDVCLYTCYRNDNLTQQLKSTPAEIRGQMQLGKSAALEPDWNNQFIDLELEERKSYRHIKLVLDQDTGEGKMVLESLL